MEQNNRPLGWTTLEESKQLVEAGLPIETADMSYKWDFDDSRYVIATTPAKNWRAPKYAESTKIKQVLPCWSLGALINLLPEVLMDGIRCYPVIRKPIYTGQWQVAYINGLYETHHYETSIEAVIEMLIWLLNNKFYEQEKC